MILKYIIEVEVEVKIEVEVEVTRPLFHSKAINVCGFLTIYQFNDSTIQHALG